MSASKSEHLTRGGLAVVLCAVVLAAGFGAGYRSSNAVLSNASAYVQKGHKVAHVNADNRQSDAETDAARKLATGRERLEVVQVSPDAVYVINHDTGAIYRIPTDTLDPKLVEQRKESRKQLQVVSGGKRTYLVDSKRGKLTQLDERTGDRRGDVATPTPIQAAVVDSRGTAWALSGTSGELYVIVDAAIRATHPVAAPDEKVVLTLAGDRPILFRPESGSAVMYGLEGVVRRIDTPVTGPVVVSRSGADATTLAVVQRSNAELVTVDFATGNVAQVRLNAREGHDFGPPVIFRNRVYVPDHSRRHVVVVALPSMRVLGFEPVPGQTSFEVFARDGRVWVNDPYWRYMFSFDADGRASKPIDKGDGDGVEEEAEPEPEPRPSDPPRSAGPPVAPRPNPSRVPGSPRSRPSPRPQPPRMITVPDVVGQDITQACRRITQAGLECAPVAKPDGAGATGQVLSSDPPGGSKVKAGAGTKVTLVYRGPAKVPNVVGMQSDQACRALQQASLGCAEYPDGVAQAAGDVKKVTSQQPAPDSQIATGSSVTIVYPNTVAVPPLDGVDPGTACQRLTAAGLGCGANAEAQTWEHNVVRNPSHPAGAAVPPGTAVSYTYQDTPAVPLKRYKASGQEGRFLSPGGGPPGGGWEPQPDIGGVYPPSGGVPGLIHVHQFRCVSDCGRDGRTLAYYYKSSDANVPNSRWVYEGVAFTCFGGALSGTRELVSMRNERLNAWAFAPVGTGEYAHHRENGYVQAATICHVWFGVPPFRPNG